MFSSIEIPFGCVMLFNAVNLKPGVTVDDVELALGEMCNVVKNTYGNEKGGFIGGQVYKYAGFISDEGSVGNPEQQDDKASARAADIAIVTYWKSFDQHEKSHADAIFKEKFDALGEYCEDTWELGYEMLWQGTAED